MKKLTSLLLLVAIMMTMFAANPALAGDTLAFTAEVAVPSNSFVYKGSTEDLVIPIGTAVSNGTTFNKTTLGYGSIGGHIIAASFLSVDKAIALVSGSSVDSLKIISMPTTPKDATVVYSLSLGAKTTQAEIAKFSDTKFIICYKTSATGTTAYANVITVNAGKTTLTLGTADSLTVGTQEVNLSVARVSATVGAIYFTDGIDTIAKHFSTATGTLEVGTGTMIHEGIPEELVNDIYSTTFAFIAHTAGASPIFYTQTSNGSTMSAGTNVTLGIADTAEIGDVCVLDTTHAVMIYKIGTISYVQAINFQAGTTGEALAFSTETIGDNWNLNRMLVKLNPTHVIASAHGVIKSYTLNTSTLALTLFGSDAFEADETYSPMLFDVYGDGVTTNPAILKTHYDRPNTHFRKNTYIDYTVPARVGFVATGVAANATCSVQLNGVITKTATSLTSGVPLYIDNNSALSESTAGCADITTVGTKLRGSSVLMK